MNNGRSATSSYVSNAETAGETEVSRGSWCCVFHNHFKSRRPAVSDRVFSIPTTSNIVRNLCFYRMIFVQLKRVADAPSSSWSLSFHLSIFPTPQTPCEKNPWKLNLVFQISGFGEPHASSCTKVTRTTKRTEGRVPQGRNPMSNSSALRVPFPDHGSQYTFCPYQRKCPCLH